MTLFWRRVFADLIKVQILSCSYPGLTVSSLDPRGGGTGHTEARERSCEDGGRDWRVVAISPGTRGAARIWKRQRQALSWSLRREHGPEGTFSPF